MNAMVFLQHEDGDHEVCIVDFTLWMLIRDAHERFTGEDADRLQGRNLTDHFSATVVRLLADAPQCIVARWEASSDPTLMSRAVTGFCFVRVP